ncbi:hypothetical protein BX616_000980 [Lobosporangium transversale]|uniref:Uncharacterized protein n=1 Tax=Lobosporangium transversale TaxID=64571 RepID=A0A1Y2H0S8_9FUNG|nr:hypothetical protein BCR41DRAFT_347746 [Lobosporangium transversale]KAF9917444.1 hypothetical protein BX616_000980 [Lobosporangium transversale]ORZ26672.1 hypothetical protein BCR41DRAFT_347746 [Lobosporangium transversale]|eukprot:XP_021884435.1 hypothetical protein BCR41DRAFT_347746 [Lobosporangium transversale]
MSTAQRQNPFDVHEIRKVLIKALDANTAVACSQLSTAWAVDIAAHLWHTVDLKEHPKMSELDLDYVSRNGRHVRIAKNILKRSQLDIFMDPSVQYLECLTMRIKPKKGYQHQAVELIHRNVQTLKTLELWGTDDQDDPTDFNIETLVSEPSTTASPSPAQEGGQPSDSSSTSLSISSPSTVTQLLITRLTIKNFTMRRGLFEGLLKGCPHLKDIEVRRLIFKDQDTSELQFRHESVSRLASAIEQVFNVGSERAKVPFLAYFPNLEYWDTWSSKYTLDSPTSEEIKTAVQEYCPKVREYLLSDSSNTILEPLLSQTAVEPSLVCFRYKIITPSIILGCVLHKATLTTIRTCDSNTGDWAYKEDAILGQPDPFEDAWMVHLVMSNCSKLTHVILPEHEMEMQMIEHFPWTCMDLQELRIRVKGLNTKAWILKAIKKWSKAYYAKNNASLSEVPTLESEKNKLVEDAKDKGHKEADIIQEATTTTGSITSSASQEQVPEATTVTSIENESAPAPTTITVESQTTSDTASTPAETAQAEAQVVTNDPVPAVAEAVSIPTDTNPATVNNAAPDEEQTQVISPEEAAQIAEAAAELEADAEAAANEEEVEEEEQAREELTEEEREAIEDARKEVLIDQVVEHLLKFEKLKTLSLGYGIWRV